MIVCGRFTLIQVGEHVEILLDDGFWGSSDSVREVMHDIEQFI